MTVYVDCSRIPFGRMIMCHMLADSQDELYEMSDKIGVRRKWIQNAGSHREHFDICQTKRALAIKHGARVIDWRELAELMNKKRKEASNGDV